jgi:hypothetical protein
MRLAVKTVYPSNNSKGVEQQPKFVTFSDLVHWWTCLNSGNFNHEQYRKVLESRKNK